MNFQSCYIYIEALRANKFVLFRLSLFGFSISANNSELYIEVVFVPNIGRKIVSLVGTKYCVPMARLNQYY